MRILGTLCRVSLSPDSCVRADRVDVPAVRPGVDVVRQIHPRICVGGNRAGGRDPPELRQVRRVRRGRRRAVGRRRRGARVSVPGRHRRHDGEALLAGRVRLDAGRRRALRRGFSSSGCGATCSSGSCGWTASPSTSCASSSTRKGAGDRRRALRPDAGRNRAHSGRARDRHEENRARGSTACPSTARSSSTAPARTRRRAVKVAQKLRKLGFKRMRPLLGGIDAWIEAGHEVEH